MLYDLSDLFDLIWMLGMWDVRDVGCGMFASMWDVDLQNANKETVSKLDMT